MNKPNFFIAGMIAAGCLFTSCSDRTVATTDADQYPTEGTETTTTTGTTDDANTGVADAGTTDNTGDYANQETNREDVSATGETVEMDRMGAGGADIALESLPAATRELVTPMVDMMQQLRSQQPSGNIDQDFASMMIVHHQGAINMSNQVLQAGDNNEIISQARQLITNKQQEIDQLQQFAGDQSGMSGQQNASGQVGSDPARQLMAATEGTLEEVQQQELNGDADHDYAHVLILHHQDAIEMAQVQLEHGQNAELKALAQQIIDKNRSEIEALEAWAGSNSR